MWTEAARKQHAPRKGRYPGDLTDEEWALIEPLIPAAKRGGGKRTVVMREVVNGVMYVLSTGCQWRALPKDLPPRSTVHGYLDLWNWDGTLERIHHALYAKCREQAEREASPTAAIIDSQSVKSAEKGGAASTLAGTMHITDVVRDGRYIFIRANHPAPAAEDKVECQVCKRPFLSITVQHLEKHGLTIAEYRKKYGAPVFGGRWEARLRKSMTKFFEEMTEEARVARFSSGPERIFVAALQAKGLVPGVDFEQQKVLHEGVLRRDNQGERAASIRMRMCRG